MKRLILVALAAVLLVVYVGFRFRKIGGFSAGAVMGAGLILYSSAFGYKKISKVITEKFVKTVTLASLLFQVMVVSSVVLIGVMTESKV